MMRSTPNRQTNQKITDKLANRAEPLVRTGLGRALLIAAGALAIALAPSAAFAQHGGGGGGHFGGSGGGHFGGGGGSHYSGSGSGSHGHYSGTTSSTHSGFSGSSARPSTGPITVVRGNQAVGWRGAPLSNSPRPIGPASGFVAGRAPQHVTIGFPPDSAGRGIVTAGGGGAEGRKPIVGREGGVLSFSGQGHDIWQNSPQSPGRNAGALTQSRLFDGQRPRPVGPHRFYGGFFGPGYGYGFGGFYPWGFGWGLGLGLGLDCDPLWNFGCGGYGYSGSGYYGPYEPGAYLYPGDDSGAAVSDSSQDYGAYSDQNTTPDNSAASASANAVIYLNDGTSFAVTDYWVADYKLHYLIDGARENVIDLDQIDVQRTVDENAARGVNFTLRPAPDSEQR